MEQQEEIKKKIEIARKEETYWNDEAMVDDLIKQGYKKEDINKVLAVFSHQSTSKVSSVNYLLLSFIGFILSTVSNVVLFMFTAIGGLCDGGCNDYILKLKIWSVINATLLCLTLYFVIVSFKNILSSPSIKKRLLLEIITIILIFLILIEVLLMLSFTYLGQLL